MKRALADAAAGDDVISAGILTSDIVPGVSGDRLISANLHQGAAKSAAQLTTDNIITFGVLPFALRTEANRKAACFGRNEAESVGYR